MTNENKSFRDILRAEFQNRLRQDPHYRLLDFARDLSTPISRMSEIMSGRSGISTQRALHYADTLKLNDEARISFLELVSNECSRTKWTRKTASYTNGPMARKLLSASCQIPTNKKEEFAQYLQQCVQNWSIQNKSDQLMEALVTVEATENGY